ncbi:MAG: gliding motility-associated C-terminal domain-containing protein [Saprospiraceae bacterium]
MNKLSFLLLLGSFFPVFASVVTAQVNPPVLECVVNDTLYWQPGINTCGTFQAYQIFWAISINGPYNLLATVHDPAQLHFYHQDANNQLYYYYMASLVDCPGQPVLYSDTLDNLIPLAGGIEYVTVQNGQVVLGWEASPSPETIGYIISRESNAMGTVVLDTVYGVNTYLDVTALPSVQQETYYVEALDACGNKSLVSDPHTTMLVNYTPPSGCTPDLIISWNAYEGWDASTTAYDIYISVDGAPPALAGTTNGNTLDFTFSNANDGENICFFVEAVETTTGWAARSNEICFGVDIIQPIRDIYALGASVVSDGEVEVEWWWDVNALVTSASIERFYADDDVVLPLPLGITPPTSFFQTDTDTDVETTSSAIYYQISATDQCGNSLVSNETRTPFLRGAATQTGNSLSWDGYTHPYATSVSYELRRLGGGGILYAGSELAFIDEAVNQADAAGVCYQLTVIVDFEIHTGDKITRELTSQVVCVLPVPKVYVPNVFAPNGVNSIFRPQLSVGMPAQYEMLVFDRWGGQVFQSTDISNGWNGRRNQEPMPEGVYVYFIRIQTPQGEMIDIQGDVMLLR